jgi:UDP-2,3-diacylglucosamine hydrolase
LRETAASPEVQVVEVPAAWRSIAFISDLHLCEEMPQTKATFIRFLDGFRHDALFILGDLFEVWVGDEALDFPFEGECSKALRSVAAKVPVHVMHGNRDFLLGPRFFRETGCLELADPVLIAGFGKLALFTHGDQLCVSDTAYQRFRSEVRQPAWKRAFLARPLRERIMIARQMRAASQAHQKDSSLFADADEALGSQWLRQAQAKTLVHGHTHRPESSPFGLEGFRHVLSDWDFDCEGSQRGEALVWSEIGWERERVPAAR